MNYKIGLDISGGDYAPQNIFEGAVLARKEFKNAKLYLIGIKNEIEKEAIKRRVSLTGFEIVDASEKIEMGESPVLAIRRKKNSSIVTGFNLLKEKKIDAFVSAGDTGACVAGATLIVGLIDEVERPGIGILMPSLKKPSIIVDVGANIEPKPLHLLQYGVMASVYYNLLLNKKNPTIGLLNIGEEASKGGEFFKSVHKLFTMSKLNFVGNVEAKNLFKGDCDCIVCDGFIGNIALKVTEGCAEAMGKFLKEAISADPLGKIGYLLLRRSFMNFKKRIDYAEYGGAPLLGVNGVVIIAHGRSNAQAIKNACRAAIYELDRNVNDEIKRSIHDVCQDSGVRQILTV